MTTRFDNKPPGASVTLEFDFSGFGPVATSPTVEIDLASGEDPDLTAVKVGSPSVVGTIVRQAVTAGLHGLDYIFTAYANVGGGRPAIVGILPVRDAPIETTAVPVYVTEAAFAKKFNQRELTDLLSGGNVYAEVENDAAGLVNGYLSGRYTLPLAEVPSTVIGWVSDITRYRLWDDHAPEEVRRRYEDALAQLKLLADGKISLPPGTEGPAATVDPVVMTGFSACRVFTQETLRGY